MKIVDMHCDTISELWKSKKEGRPQELSKNDLHIDIRKMKQSGYLLQNFAMYTDLGKVSDPFDYVMELIDLFYEEIEKNKNDISVIKTYEDIIENERQGKLSALKPGDAVISAQAQGSGFEVRRCRFGHNRALGLRIRGSQGVIENNTIERTECHAIKIAPEYEWMEGGSSRDIVVRGNIIRNCGGGILAGENNILGKPLPCGALRNIAVEGNVISGGASPVAAIGCDNISIAGNVIESALHETASAIELKNVREAEPSPRLDWNAPEGATIEDDVLSISLSEK